MIIVYTPAGGEPEQYDAAVLKVSEAAIVQRTVDMKWQQILQGLEEDDLEAMRGIVWVIKKRSNPSLRFGEFDPGVTEMTTRLSNAEVAAYVDNAFASPDKDPDLTREMVAGVLLARMPALAVDPDHARALIEARAKDPKEAAPTPADTESPPAGPSSPSPTSNGPAASTSDSSPTSSTSPLPSSTTSPSATSTS
ncbi:hypothetical protein [Streptomyces sp. NPDC050263]|uniref:hypothetical protein n=1 Tax=Streptomyces sp. NPDC050263 TaxID=3155037 RepID=UPI00341A7055